MNLPANNPLGNTFTVNEGESIENGSRFSDANDKNINNGTILNNGQIFNFNFIDNFGNIDNNGTLTHRDDEINNFGNVTNNGTLTNSARFNNSSSFINNSLVRVFSPFNNTGTVQNFGNFSDSGTLTNGGTFENESGASFTSNLINENEASFTNNGFTDASIVNNGILTNNNTFSLARNSFRNNNTFVNNGTFNSDRGIINFGSIENSGTFIIDTRSSIFATGSFTGNPLIIEEGRLNSQDFLVDTDFTQNSGLFFVATFFGVNNESVSAFENDRPLLTVTGNFNLNGGDIGFSGGIRDLDLGTYTLVDLTDGTLTIDATVLANADDSIDRLDTEEKDFELVQQGNDLLLTIEECFLTGTRILSETGYRKVEDLAIGDLVQTADGELEPVKWIGYQSRQPNQIKNPLRGYPILFKAGSLGHNLPLRDLYTSPDHALLVDGLLINAGALVNDISIIKTEPTEPFCYWHVELEHHALLIAEGTAAESFYPNREDRLAYDNGLEYDELYPFGNSQLMLYPLDYPRISSKNKVPRYICQKLQQIAQKRNRIKDLATA
ncbi:MAG: Hint domain-containing protein [Cyanobacteria bacterium J06648_1]